jgi:flagellar hook-associated protein 3 FlgL
LRITSSILSRTATSGMQSQMRALEEAQRRVNTGLRVSRPSDDPVAAAGIVQSSSGLRELEQYRRNLESAQARLSIEDSALDQVSGSLTRVKELAVAQLNDTASDATRNATKEEVLGILDFLHDLANTQFAGSYVFGGQYSDTPPFQSGVWDPARPPAGALQVEIGAGLIADTNHSAQEIFIDSDVVDAVNAMATAMDNNDVPGIEAALVRIDDAFDTTQELVGDLGGRMSQLDVAVSNIEALDLTLQTFRSGLSDADLAEAVTQLVTRQGALEAAMLANSKILDVTLADYL